MAELIDRGAGVAARWLPPVVCALLCLLHPQPGLARDADRVEEVTVRLELSGGMVGAETLQQVESAILDTVEVALLEQLEGNLDYISRNRNTVVTTLGEVIAPVLERRGFVLEDLMLEPDRVTRLVVRLHLAEQRVQDFAVDFILLGNTPVIEALTATDEELVATELYATLARTPYNDETWLTGLVTGAVETQLARMPEYAGYTYDVLVKPGPDTTVAVAFTPRSGEPALTDYKLHLRSLSIPNLRLHAVREQAVHYLQALRGAPLGFIKAKLPELTQALYQYLINDCTLDDQHPEATLVISLNGCVLDADLRIDSERYLLTGRMRLALWDYTAGDYEARFDGRVGAVPADGWTAFFDVTYFPGEQEAYPALCIGRMVDYGLIAGGWDGEAHCIRLLGQYDFTPQLYVSWDGFTGGDYDALSEISLHYRVRDVYELQLGSSFEGEVYAAIGATF